MIEVRIKRRGNFYEHDLIVDGAQVSPNEGSVRGTYGNLRQTDKLIAHISGALTSRAAKTTFSNISSRIETLQLVFHTLIHGEIYLGSLLAVRTDESKFDVSLNCFIKPGGWRHPWSIEEYLEEFSKCVNENSSSRIQWAEQPPSSFYTNSFQVLFPDAGDAKLTIDETVQNSTGLVRQIHELTEASLRAKLQEDSVVLKFDFPEEVRVPCEQYLLYFAQFLRDLGVQADTALIHEAGQALFTVTPEDKEQALDNIRAALDVYLHLPSSPVSDAGGNDIAVLRLNSELQSLQSKLSLARAELQMKDAAIQLQRVTIAQLTGEIVFESLKNVTPTPKDKDKEELLGDIVSLVPLKGKGFEVNLPELLRKLKQLFKREE